MTHLDTLGDDLLRLLMAVLLGALIGIDRELRAKPAGLRTHMIMSLAAALFVVLARDLIDFASIPPERIRADPVRIVEAIVAAVGFLGAGTIFRSRASDRVEGLTTAASLLLSAAIGVACAIDRWPLAGAAALLSLAVLRLVVVIEERLLRRRRAAGGP